MTSFVKKFLGLILLFGGLAIILYGIYSSYNIFTAKTSAPEIFTTEEKRSVPSSDQIERLLQEQLKGLLPTDSIPQFLNLMTWSVFAGILILGGGQIAGLGIKLIK